MLFRFYTHLIYGSDVVVVLVLKVSLDQRHKAVTGGGSRGGSTESSTGGSAAVSLLNELKTFPQSSAADACEVGGYCLATLHKLHKETTKNPILWRNEPSLFQREDCRRTTDTQQTLNTQLTLNTQQQAHN